MSRVMMWVGITMLGLVLGGGVGFAQLWQPEEANRKGAAGTITKVSQEEVVLDVPVRGGKKMRSMTFTVEHDVVVMGVSQFKDFAVGDKVGIEYVVTKDKTKIAEFIERPVAGE